MKYIGIIVILVSILFGCKKIFEESSDYVKEINDWHQKRIERLKASDGWLNLVGRIWLKPGVNKFGSAKDNNVVIESDKVPAYMGEFILNDSIVTMKVYEGIEILLDEKSVKEIILIDDQKKDMTVFQYGTIKWNLIIRGDKYGIRFRDLESHLTMNLLTCCNLEL